MLQDRKMKMSRNELLDLIRRNGTGIIDRFLPSGARAELESVICDGHREVDADAWLMFMSIRALLRNGGMPSCESDCEAGRVMALLNA